MVLQCYSDTDFWLCIKINIFVVFFVCFIFLPGLGGKR